MNNTSKAYLELHFAVLLFGFTAILGKVISLDSVVLVWWRVLLTSISLLFLINFGKKLRQIPKHLVLRFMGIGILVALHWIFFFGSIKYSNPSICLVCLATTSFFTSLIEPIITRQPFKWHEIGLGLMIIPGMILVVQSTDISMMLGIWFGLLSALLAALFSTFNKLLIEKADSLSITFLELGSGWIFISLCFPFYFYFTEGLAFWPTASDWKFLLILSLLCTTLAYVLNLRALRYISAFAANLTINLEPVYGIILAASLLNDRQELSNQFYWGALIILLAVFCYPFLKKRFAGREGMIND